MHLLSNFEFLHILQEELSVINKHILWVVISELFIILLILFLIRIYFKLKYFFSQLVWIKYKETSESSMRWGENISLSSHLHPPENYYGTKSKQLSRKIFYKILNE